MTSDNYQINSTPIYLKPGREKAIRDNRSLWVFSGAIADQSGQELGACVDGDILPLYSHDKQFLAWAYFNRKSGIIGRVISLEELNPVEILLQNIKKAVDKRRLLFGAHVANGEAITNGYRAVNAEADLVPGLVIDIYDQIWVLQSGTLGIDRLKSTIVQWLLSNYNPVAIIEKSNAPSRKEEGLAAQQGLLAGKLTESTIFRENGHSFYVEFANSQKTGFFLDQREMRALVEQHAAHRRVLNTFCYSGAFSVYAGKGKAASVLSLDSSEKAINWAQENMKMNGLTGPNYEYLVTDAFDFLKHKTLDYDFVILDPPAFAKKKSDVANAIKGYREINRLVLKKVPAKSLLLTCSCSYFMNEELFQQVLFQAAREAGRAVQILQRHRLAMDHPVSLFHPESDYLKSFLLYID